MRKTFIFRATSNGDHYFGWNGFISPFKPANVPLVQQACWYIDNLKLSYYIYHSLANGNVAIYGIEYKGEFYNKSEDPNVFVREEKTGAKKAIRFIPDNYGCLEDVVLEES